MTSSYIDAVLNHKFGADKTEVFKAVEVAQDDRTKELSEPHDITVRPGRAVGGLQGLQHLTLYRPEGLDGF